MKLFKIPSKDEIEAKPYIIRTVVFGIITLLIVLFIFVPYTWIRIVFALIWGLSAYQTIFGIISIFTVISQRKELKSKYNVEISKDDVLFWIINSTEPDEIVVEFNNCKIRIDIRFDFTGNSHKSAGKFVDKGIYINQKEYSLDSCINYLSQIIDSDLIYIVWYTENNNPELFVKMINKMKKVSSK